MKFNPLRIFGSKKPIEQKVSAAGVAVSMGLVNQPVWTERDFYNLSRESYNLNAVAFRCVKIIASGAATIPLLLKDRSDKDIESHALIDLIRRPSPMVGQQQFFEQVYGYLMLAGNSYVEQVAPSDNKPPRELWTLRPDRIKIIAGDNGMPAFYEYEVFGRRVRWPVDQLTGESRVMHLKEFHPTDDWYGLSRVEAAAYALDRHNAASIHNKALLDNGARPSGALIFEPVKVGDNAIPAPASAIDAAVADLETRHQSPSNAGKPLVFGGNVRWEEMGLSPKDMDFGEGKADAARDICTAFGVPHILVVPGSATYNNIKEAKLELYEETILPLADNVLTSFNYWLCPKFGDGLKFEPDLDEISALEPRRESKRKTIVELKNSGILTDDEARDALQYGKRDPNSVQKVDPSVLNALLQSVQTVGMTPLFRYMRSVGLVEPNATEKDLLDAAMELLDDQSQSEDQQDPNQQQEDQQQDSTEETPGDQGSVNEATQND